MNQRYYKKTHSTPKSSVHCLEIKKNGLDLDLPSKPPDGTQSKTTGGYKTKSLKKKTVIGTELTRSKKSIWRSLSRDYGENLPKYEYQAIVGNGGRVDGTVSCSHTTQHRKS